MSTSTTLRLLASLLLSGSTAALGACGSTVVGDGDDGASSEDGSDGSDDDGSDDGSDGGSCDFPAPENCADEPICRDSAWICTLECEGEFVGDCIDGTAVCVDGSWVCQPNPECPFEMPVTGGACEGDLVCEYDDGEDCGGGMGTVSFACIDGSWSEARTFRCSPVECPETEPTVGTTCDMWDAYCEYESEMDCGPASIAYTCDEGVWAYAGESVPRCALPDCRDLGDSTSCAELGCRWLEPGCDENPLAAAGCFATAPCESDGCFYADEVCTQVSIDPCVEDDCDACGQQESLCIATTGAER